MRLRLLAAIPERTHTMTPINWALIVGAGTMRNEALETAERLTDDVVAEVRRAQEAGTAVNLTEVATRSGVSRATLYRKLGER